MPTQVCFEYTGLIIILISAMYYVFFMIHARFDYVD